MWRKFVQDYFSFNRQERRGIIVLIILILLAWCVPMVFKYFHKNKPQDIFSFQKKVAIFRHQQDSLNRSDKKKYISQNILDVNQLPSPFPFDPNTLSADGWQKLGVSLHLIHTLKHYLKAGGHFYKKEDLKKIYGLSPKLYQHLEPYIHIADKESPKSTENKYKRNSQWPTKKNDTFFAKNLIAKRLFTVDINKADSAAWVKLRGIGPVLSSRIVHFRNSLGGFYNISQVAAVYGLPDSTFQAIKKQLKISPFALKKININTATVQELKSHPYISYRLAASIKAFRDQHGRFKSVEGLKQLQLVDDQIYRKLAPYLTVK